MEELFTQEEMIAFGAMCLVATGKLEVGQEEETYQSVQNFFGEWLNNYRIK